MAGNEASSLTRRSFLKATAMTAGAAAVVGTAGCTTVAEQSEEEVAQAVEEKTYTNWCRGNCGGPCALSGTVREGKLVKTTPTFLPKEAKALQTGCVRGMSTPQRVYAANRVLYPMKQTGQRGSDNWERIAWDEAYALIAEKFKAAEAQYGPRSIVVSFGCGNATGAVNGFYARYGARVNYFHGIAGEMFLRRTGYTETFYSSDALGMWMAQMVLMQPSNSVEDIKNAKTCFFFGTNPAESATRSWPHICEAKEKGTKLVCIDPMYSKTAAFCDVWVPVRPGTDGALLLAMCNYIIENDLVNWDYLRNGSIAPLLVKEDGGYLRLSDLGMDPVLVANAAGDDVETDSEVVYDEATGTFGSCFEVKDPAVQGEFDANGVKVRPIYEVVSSHIKQFDAEFAAEECGISVDLVNEVSKLYAESVPAKVFTFNGWAHQANSYYNYFNLGLLVSLTGNAGIPGGGYGQLGMLMEGSSCMLPPVRIDYDGPVKSIKDPKYNFGFTTELLPQVLETGKWNGEDYPVKCLFNSHQNLLGSQMGPSYMKKAFEKLDFIVCADSYMTYTAQYSDLVLPISLSWEDDDMDTSFFMQKAVEPLGECKSTFDMFAGLSSALGYDDLYEKSQQDYLRDMLDLPENLEVGRGFDAYHDQGALYGEYKYGEIVLPENNQHGARTMFYVENLITLNEYGQTFTMEERMPGYVHSSEAYKDNPLREKYPLFANNFHNHYFGQTFTANIPMLDELRGFEGEPYMLIHPTAAEERGIETGDNVKIFNDHGYVVCKAVVSSGIREDTIVSPHGWGHDQYIEGDPQDLVGMAIDPVACNNNYNDWLCQVEKM